MTATKQFLRHAINCLDALEYLGHYSTTLESGNDVVLVYSVYLDYSTAVATMFRNHLASVTDYCNTIMFCNYLTDLYCSGWTRTFAGYGSVLLSGFNSNILED